MKITLRAARVNVGLTIIESAKALGINKTTLSSYEKGRTFPKPKMISKMEKLYNRKYDDFIFLD